MLEDITIHSIVDIVKDTPAFQLAQELNIATSTDGDAALETFKGDIVIDVTGDKALHQKLMAFM